MLTPFQARAVRALSRAPIFGALGDELAARAHRRFVRRGEILFEKGQPCRALYGIVNGRMTVFCGTPSRLVALELLGPGELLAALEVSCGGRHHTSARAMAHSELIAIGCDALDELFEARPELRGGLGIAASRAVAQLTQRAEDLAFLSLESRLEKLLAELADRVGESVTRGTRLPVRQQDLADMLGVSRESVNRALASPGLRDRVAPARGSITLVDASAA